MDPVVQSLGPATARLVSSRSSVTAPVNRPLWSITAINGLLLVAITVATSSSVASGGTVAGLGTGLGRQSPTVRFPGPCQRKARDGTPDNGVKLRGQIAALQKVNQTLRDQRDRYRLASETFARA